jgi:hypothetical protein
MSPLIKPLNATSVGSAIAGPKSVTGVTLLGALLSGNRSLAMTALGRGGQMPQAGVDAGQNDVSTAGQNGDDSGPQ